MEALRAAGARCLEALRAAGAQRAREDFGSHDSLGSLRLLRVKGSRGKYMASCMPSGCLDGRFVGAYGIFTSVKMDISRYISLIDIGDMWNLPL